MHAFGSILSLDLGVPMLLPTPPPTAAPSPFSGAFLPELISNLTVVVAAGVVAFLTTERWASTRQRIEAQRARRLATAEELYRAYGEFFAVWKLWEYYTENRRGGDAPYGDIDTASVESLVAQAASVEGMYESFLVRVTVEQTLEDHDEAALWALRFALRKLRLMIRKNQPLAWYRLASGTTGEVSAPEYREYEAFKGLVAVASEIASRTPSRLVGPPDGYATLARVTGAGAGYVTRHALGRQQVLESMNLTGGAKPESGWEWLPVAEGLLSGRRAARSA